MKIFILFLFLIACITARGQYIVNGTVFSSEDNAPLSGATIKSSDKTTNTDEMGQFKIALKKGLQTIQISFTGYQERLVNFQLLKDTTISITLSKAATLLEEITVSTGYQNIPRERSTGSFTIVDQKTLNQQVSTDVLSRLESVANGLTVDRGTSPIDRITIRGLSTISGPKDALIVVDNFPYNGDINNINPNDVENITILKDAAAASIWGAKAANGVIVISTKKGRYNQPFAIGFNSNVTVSNKPDLFAIRQMSSSDFIDVEQMLYFKGYYTDWINSTTKRALSNVVEILRANAADSQEQLNALRELDVRNDFNKYIYQRPVNQQYALNLTGGSEIMNWIGSAAYDQNVSNLDANYDRLNIRIRNTYKPIKNIEITGGILFTHSNQKSGRQGYGSISQDRGSILPYARFADEYGNSLSIIKSHSQSYLETEGNGKLLDWRYYPLEDYKYIPETSSLQDVLLNAGVNFRILPGLNADLKYQYESQISNNRTHYGPSSYYTRDLINKYTQINSSGEAVNIIPRGGILDLSNANLKSHDLRGQLNFHKSWGQSEVSAIAGSEIRRANSTGNSNRLYGYNDDILSYGTLDYSKQYPNFISGTNSFIPGNLGISDRRTNYISSYANASYTYSRRYTLSISGRRDASNLFGLNTNDQWNPFWSTGLAWVVSEEPFFKDNLLSFLKLRATYGFSGNIDPAMSAATTIEYTVNSPYTLTPVSRFINYNNPDLKWETSKMLNIGLDFRSKADRLNGSLEFYQKKGDNLFGAALIDYTSGVGNSVVKNVASMLGQGLDLSLNSFNLTGSLQWQTNLNLSYYKDKVTNYYLPSTQASNFISANVPISGLTGKPVYSMFGYKWRGLDPTTGDPQGEIGGKISKEYNLLTGSDTQITDLTYFGSALPTFFGNLSNTLSFKNLSLNFSMIYKLGYYFRKKSINYSSLYASWLGNSDYALRWQKLGDEAFTDVPSMVYPASSSRDSFYEGSEALIEKADHIRLQYINLSYRIDKTKWKQLPFNNLHIYFNASNLGILWRANSSGIDPDNNYPVANPVPNSRNYSIGLRANIN